MRTVITFFILVGIVLFGAACGEVDPGHVPPEGTVFPQERVITGNSGDFGDSTTGSTSPDIAPGMRADIDGQTLSVGEGNVAALSSQMAAMTTINAALQDSSGGVTHTFNFGFETAAGEYGATGYEAWLTPPPDFSKAGVQYIRTESDSTAGSNSSDVSGTVTIISIANQRVVGFFDGNATVDGASHEIEAEFNVPRVNQP